VSTKIDENFTGGDGPPNLHIHGATLLQEVREWFVRFVSTTTDADLDLLTLWAAHTQLIAEVYTTPRLQLDSPVPGSGKTTCLEHLQRLCLRPVLMATVSSPALLTRMLQKEHRTILIDEADRTLRPDKEGVADVLAVINSGYKRGATRPVLVQVKGGNWEPVEMPTYAAVAVAGNNPDLPDDTRSRIIRVLLLPDLDGSVEESNWESIESEALHLQTQLADWADQVREEVRSEQPDLPEGITGRFREKWSPLKRVAVAAGGRWPAAVDQMALHDREEHDMDKEDGVVREVPAVRLLSHIWELWPGEETFVATGDLISTLVAAYPTVWGEAGPFGKPLTGKRLGTMLSKGYKIHSKQPVRGGPRGYLRADFIRAWHRMGIGHSQSDASDGSGVSDAGSSDTSAPSLASDWGRGSGQPMQGCAGNWQTCPNTNCREAFHECVLGVPAS
jgi:hypothetical protein